MYDSRREIQDAWNRISKNFDISQNKKMHTWKIFPTPSLLSAGTLALQFWHSTDTSTRTISAQRVDFSYTDAPIVNPPWYANHSGSWGVFEKPWINNNVNCSTLIEILIFIMCQHYGGLSHWKTYNHPFGSSLSRVHLPRCKNLMYDANLKLLLDSLMSCLYFFFLSINGQLHASNTN